MLCGALAACQAVPRGLAGQLVHHSLWQEGQALVAGAPVAYAWRPGQGPWRVYVEGDGNAFTAQGRPSPNPTPLQPVALQLAQRDASTAPVLYLGRPCQWVRPTAACTRSVWTTQRFTQAVMADYTQLVQQLTGGQVRLLVGFSGGAWVAYGVAQQLPQVPAVVTVAGNLNPNLINRHHRVPELAVAPWPNPRQDLSLTMLWGAKDTTIPAVLATHMATATVAGCKQSQTVPGTTHVKGWPAWWATHSATMGAPCGDLGASGLQNRDF